MTNAKNPPCPKCGAATLEKKSNKPGILRWFPCSQYPRCNGAVREFAAPALAARATAWDAAKATPAPAPVGPKRTPSIYQQAIYDWITTGTGNAVVEAVAGSGKTTTMVDALERTTGRVLFTAFNAAIAAELATRAPGHVTVSTLHSLGFRAVKKAFPGATVDKDGSKVDEIVMAEFPPVMDAQGDKNMPVRKVAVKLISLAKATLVDATNLSAVENMADRFGVECDDANDLRRVVQVLNRMLTLCKNDTTRVDFDDMVWFPVRLGLAVERFDWVMVDETQDMNANQLELVMMARKPGARTVCVGDRFQSIYGFRGADTQAMPNIVARLEAKVFPLSITYRCPVSHVAMAQALVPAIQARPGAPEGTIGDLMLDKALELMKTGDLVMCRTNAPLVRVAFSLIRQGRKAIIRGREIGTGLISLIRKIAGKPPCSTPELVTRMAEYLAREVAKLTAAKKSTATLMDKVETINVLAEGTATVAEIVAKIEAVFSDADAGVVCSSVHRAKGFEADRTFIVSPELMPHPSAKKAWEIEQENNIKYVALTRAKLEMYFVTIPKEG